MEQQIHQAALKFIAERKIFEHVSRANSDFGVAPSSQDTAAEYLRVCDDLGGDVLNFGLRRALNGQSSTPATAKRIIRKLSRSFRKRWGLGLGSLQTRDPMLEPEVAEKAGFSCLPLEFEVVQYMSGLLASGCTRDPVWNQTCNGFMHHFRFDSSDQFCVLFWGSSFGPHLRDSLRNGAELRGPFPAPKHAKLCLQAALFWKWMAWLERQVEPPVQPLLLNLDETALSYSFHQAIGLYVRRLRRNGKCYSQVRKNDLRGTVTHVAIIADRSEVQPKLPQLTISNRHRFTHGLLASVGADKPAFVHLFQRESSWNNITVMCEILELLAAA